MTRARPQAPAMAALVGLGLLLSACGSPQGTSAGSPRTGSSAGTVENGGGDTTGAGTEAAGVRFVSTRFRYRVDGPGPMTEAADGVASASRGVERLSIKVITGGPAADLRGYAIADLQAVKSDSPNFRQAGNLGTIKISGHPAIKAVYQSTNGNNPVTGKPLDLFTVRYYIPRDSNTAAVLTYSITAAQYDPQGADDVASTFAWQ